MAKLINLRSFKEFFSSASAGGVLLLLSVAISLIMANTGHNFLEGLLAEEVGYSAGPVHLRYSLLTWINDGLMAVFFLLVGLEIKREVREGELSSLRKASLPILAALGGVLVPAAIFTAFNHGTPAAAGWGIPMATDIAFALGILSLLGSRIPPALKVFLAALAIADDLLAILVIAIFYSKELHFGYLGGAAVIFLLLLAFNRFGCKKLIFYVLPGAVMWYLIHHSGIHATIAGALTAATLPTTEDDTESPLEKLEHLLSKPVNFIIMPLFALANTNMAFKPGMLQGLVSGLGFGITLGLLAGKPIGIFLMSRMAVLARVALLPKGVRWKHILGVGLLGGIGFTMSIFISLLSFDDPGMQDEAKFAVLIGSFFSAIAGVFILLSVKGKKIGIK